MLYHCHDTSLFRIDFISGITPAAGANYALLISGVYRYALSFCHFTLTTSAVAANRFVRVGFISGITIVAESVFIPALTASLTWHLDLQPGAPVSYAADPGNHHICAGCGNLAVLNGVDQFFITVDNIDAADQIANIRYGLKVWLSPEAQP